MGIRYFFLFVSAHEILPLSLVTSANLGRVHRWESTSCLAVCCFYFGGARSKGFSTLRNVSKLQFFDKIGQAKSVGFRLYSAI